MKHPTSFRLSPTALRVIARRAKKLGISKTAVIEMAVRDDRSLPIPKHFAVVEVPRGYHDSGDGDGMMEIPVRCALWRVDLHPDLAFEIAVPMALLEGK